MSPKSNKNRKTETNIVQQGLGTDKAHGAVMPPIYLTSNYTFEGYDKKRQYDYARSGNPTRDNLADALNELEGGAGATVTGSGMGALTLILHLVQPGETIVAPHDCYGGTFRLLSHYQAQGRLNLEFIDQTDDFALTKALEAKPKLILIETPSNPLLRITDIERVTSLAKANGVLVAADNTFLSPALQNPLELGVDVVMHSTTKYINGHSDVVGGAVVAKTQELAEELAFWANCLGLTGNPFDSFLTLRGLRTLFPRIRQQTETTKRLVEFLDNHPMVSKVYYPGLESHKGHDIAKKQQKDFGAMLSFEVVGDVDNVKTLIESTETFTLAESLGGVESLISHPATMTHAAMTPEARENAGILDQLIRLSVGIEHADDLIADLENALNRCLKPQNLTAAE